MKMRFIFTGMTTLVSLTIVSTIQPCIITFTNDSAHNIRIFDVKENIVFDLKKNKSRRFGSPHEQAHIKIYEQFKNGIFNQTFEIKQTQCSNNGNPRLKLSDLERKTGDAYL